MNELPAPQPNSAGQLEVAYTIGPYPAETQAGMTLIPGLLDTAANDNGANCCVAATSCLTDRLGNPAFVTPGGAKAC